MKAIVHIGTPKTGTTTLQHALVANREALERQGVLHRVHGPRPNQSELLIIAQTRIGRPVSDGILQRIFGFSSMDGQSRVAEEMTRRIDADIETTDCPRCLFSCEMLGWPYRRRRSIQAYHDFFSERFDEVEYIIYLRPQDSWMLSSYSQNLKNGGTDTMAEHLARFEPPDYDAFVRRLESVVGPERLQVRLFDRARFEGGDFLTDFSHAADLEGLTVSEEERRNEKLTAVEAARMRRVNEIAARLGHGWPGFLLRIGLNRSAALLERGGAPALAFSEEDKARIREVAAPSNEALRRYRFPELDTLFPSMA
ncbi:hypothetical protein [Histidinibacterium aquaticum]|uniref:Sulfotransferase family protein n=1 Tax=Histidinibacterium aquaticum TaxID=2613962 RepID=A0A5J5GAD1_9RHOB|nr:hypothetical protein [Histidinibacterium aquaticum]KAA9005089.1 hypothetical protein F3S47_18850 [Histidinibacterium aquaticum]